jgi:hypothetical protein
MPCVEIWDMNGLVFTSHNGLESKDICTWSAEYGDGSFQVSHDILGVFAVICRFGANQALKKDVTTLIFTYQNSTAFLPCEVVELKLQNVDFNPEYISTLDTDQFTVHLMFEESSAASSEEDSFGRSNCVLQTYPSSVHSSLAFDRGLEEICKNHYIEPDASKVKALLDRNFPEKYVLSALRFSNNSIDISADLIGKMIARAAQLERSKSSDKNSTSNADSISYSAIGHEIQQPTNRQLVRMSRRIGISGTYDQNSSKTSQTESTDSWDDLEISDSSGEEDSEVLYAKLLFHCYDH